MYSNPVVGTVLCQIKLEGHVSVRDVKAFFEQKVKAFPELTCFISTFLGFWCLKRDLDFAIENHVFENLDVGAKLEKLKSELLNSPYPASRSPWSVYIIRTGTNSILLFRIHHVLGDGYSLMQILSEDKDIKRPYFPQNFWQRPVLFIKSVFTILPTFKGIPVTNDNFTSTKSFLVEATNGIPLSWLKEIRAKEGTKFLAIPITAATMALQDLYNNKGLEKQEFFGFYAPVPPPEPIGKGMRNGLAVTTLSVSSSQKDIQKLLQQVNASLLIGWEDSVRDYYKMYIYGAIPAWAWKYVGWVPALTAVSDFPGPEETVNLAGQKMIELAFWSNFLWAKTGVILTCLSYNGIWKPRIFVSGDLCESQEMAQDLVDSLGKYVKVLYSNSKFKSKVDGNVKEIV